MCSLIVDWNYIVWLEIELSLANRTSKGNGKKKSHFRRECLIVQVFLDDSYGLFHCKHIAKLSL